MTRPVRNLAASIRQRLANLAMLQGRPSAEVQQYFAMERFLYRLAASSHRDRFVLKGAMLLVAWRLPVVRPTMDIDLLGKGLDQASDLIAIVKSLCRLEVDPPDGLEFDESSVASEQITVDTRYVGARLRFRALLGTARIRMQVDIGFGDAVLGADQDLALPPLLDLPAPRLLCYSRESAIAEKLHAMFQHGRLNSRLKDYFDIGLLARSFSFDGVALANAIAATFKRRGTPLHAEPVGLAAEMAEEPGKQQQWAAFLRKIRNGANPVDFAELLAQLRRFLHPPLLALSAGQSFRGQWTAPGPWQ